ncbi:hypothetical protein [Geomonas azotofigens]|uniref:hypothetical protein n=1 Tax=Geomonas azotofigens TaxID=2843196 RepID=UPI001C103821|nr:hypothetical protein [Geomonas azotofigens]MBU5611976.1 hypothetical protein [Geomonas azotofigens]
MKGYQLVKEIREAKGAHPDRVFIKWWRNEEDFIDFDLLDRFLQNLKEGEKIDGFELINEDEMWRTLEARCQGRISKVKRDGDWVLQWTPPPNRKVEEVQTEYPYSAESMVKILDSETNYNYVD